MGLVLVVCLCLGVIAGLRAFSAITVVAWAGHFTWIDLGMTHLTWLDSKPSLIVLTLLAVFELVNDKLPKTPSRTVPPQLAARLILGGFAGMAFTATVSQSWIVGVLLGVVGAAIGTYGGAWFRSRLSSVMPALLAALIEDCVAYGGGLLLLWQLGVGLVGVR